jgi:hypothetical protein
MAILSWLGISGMSMRKAMFLPGWERLVPTVQMVTEIL